MKKLFLYTILFISLFVGTASAIVLSGYSNYLKQPKEEFIVNPNDSILSNLTSSILNATEFGGEFTLSSSNPQNKLEGSFLLYNKESFAVQLSVDGKINNYKIKTFITIENSQSYIDYNGIKLAVNNTDIVEVVNSLLLVINETANSGIELIDIDSIKNSLCNINMAPHGNGYCLDLKLPSLCDIYLLTDAEYVPTQLLVTNIKAGKEIYSLNIKTNQNSTQLQQINKTDYLNISSSIKYIPSIINTLNQGNIRLSGTMQLKSQKIDIDLFINQSNEILGIATFNGITANFEYCDGYIILNIFDYYFKLSPSEIISLFENNFGISFNTGLEITDSSIVSLLQDFNTTIHTTKNNTIDNLAISYQDFFLNLNIGKTLYLPKKLSYSTYFSANDINNFIAYYKNIFAKNYSIDLNASYNGLVLNGKCYIEFSDVMSIKKVLFDGKLNKHSIELFLLENKTYIKINSNHIVIENGSCEKIIASIADLLNLNSNDISALVNVNFLDLIEATNIEFSYNTLKLTNGTNNIFIKSSIKNYTLEATINGLCVSARLFPNANEYHYILSKLEPDKYNNFSNANTLINAISNTLKQNTLHYTGKLSISIKDFIYKEILVDIKMDLQNQSYIISLDNLPLDPIVTYYSNLYYSNQKCILTINSNSINIYTTVVSRMFNKTACVCNKTLPLNELSVDNLYDIFGMRKNLIELIKNGKTNTGNILSNLSTDCIKMFKTKLLFSYSSTLSQHILNINANFYYTNLINSATIDLNISNTLYFYLSLQKK